MTPENKSNSKSHSGSWECNLTNLKAGTAELEITGNPETISCPYGNAIRFDGRNDGIFLQLNPLFMLSCFTIEAIIFPDSDGPEEQRFFHVGEIDGDRLLLETRVTAENKWFLDTFILSGQNKMALIDPHFIHSTGKWYHVALTVNENGQMNNYINGKFEITGNVDFKPINSGEMSIGARRNKVSWFKGAIYKIRISPKVLEPEDFITF